MKNHQMQQPSSSPTIINENENSNKHTPNLLKNLPHEILLEILSELSLSDIYNLSMCDQFCLQLCFNQRIRDFSKLRLINLEFKPILSLYEFRYRKDEKNDEEEQFRFLQTQERIWRRFVLSYFPMFEGIKMNVKNWLHVLRFV